MEVEGYGRIWDRDDAVIVTGCTPRYTYFTPYPKRPYFIADPLPQTTMFKGSVHLQRRRCGKPTCRCASGRPEDAHVAHYHFWREGGRLRKRYLKAGEVEPTRERCNQRQIEERAMREAASASLRASQTTRALLRQIESETTRRP